LPRFEAIRTEHVTPAVDHLLAAARVAIETAATARDAPSWDTVVEPLTEPLDRLQRAWGAVQHLNAVVNTPALREAYNANLPKIVDFYTDLGQDLRLFARYRALRDDAAAFAALDAAQRKVVDNELRDFRLGGAELNDADKAAYKALQEELADLSTRFEEHLLDATNAWTLHIEDEAQLAGIPDEVLAEARTAASAAGKSGWLLTLRMPCYLPVMQYAHDRDLRRRMHEAYSTRASALGAEPAWNNAPLIARILELRRAVAQLLGYANYAEVSLVPKMAQSPDEVIAFLRDLARRAKPFAERDFAASDRKMRRIAPRPAGRLSCPVPGR
jgi:oligopeptidase A